MDNFNTTSNFVSDINVKYDDLKERYIGWFTTSRGEYRIEGVNMADVMQSMELVLREEYYYLQKELASRSTVLGKERGRARGGGGGGGSKSQREVGEKVYTINSTKGVTATNLKRKSISKWADYITGGASLAAGNYLETGFVACSLMMTDLYEGIESLWDKPKEKKIFAAVFGGILITAGSRHQLRKKLWRQKNRRIHHIMMHIRAAHNVLEMNKEEDDKKKNLKRKKRLAQIQLTANWTSRVSPQGQVTGWRDRSINLRNRLEAKKELSQDLSKDLRQHQIG